MKLTLMLMGGSALLLCGILAVANALGEALPYGHRLWTANPPGPPPISASISPRRRFAIVELTALRM